ncbi:MAG: hypothetical protein K6F05_05780 [Succinivibrio sp.]|nr:hypothetical protein [Succinivibrio sp.]
MLKYICFLCCAAALWLLQGCSSLPDGARKPELTVQSVELGTKEQQLGFYVSLICHHRSPEPLPLEAVQIRVFVNGRLASDYREEPKKVSIRPRQDVVLTYFAPADKLGALARSSLSAPMVSIQAEVLSTLYFEDEEKSAFNPTATYKGVISRAR